MPQSYHISAALYAFVDALLRSFLRASPHAVASSRSACPATVVQEGALELYFMHVECAA